MTTTEEKRYFTRGSSEKASGEEKIARTTTKERPFSKINFIMMGCCLALIVVGFILMSGPGSSVEGGFNPDIFSTRRIVVGPVMAFLGFLLMAFAIVWTPAGNKKATNDNKEN